MIESSSLPPSTLRGQVIASEVQPGVEYVLLRHIGEGAMGVAYLSTRKAPDGDGPVVIKVVNPGLVDPNLGAEIFAHKEAIALGRLNERVPPCPFVVRFIDTGAAYLFGGQRAPWIAVEYVHGGVEGTTLEDRVIYSVGKTGYAFDTVRAAHAIRCIAAGLSAIHSVDVIHRDVTPGNVLCCGFGESEIFKISDFGVARSEGITRTFAGWGVGTPGYASPEQCVPGTVPIRPYTDVFAFACVTYYLLTGMHYFDTPSPVEAYERMLSKFRVTLAESDVLTPELRDRPDACQAIEQLLARATSPDPAERPATAEQFADEVLPWLIGSEPSAPHSTARLVTAILGGRRAVHPEGWDWQVRQHPRDDFVVRSAAWDTDGHCFALTPRGPRFWDGHSWLDASALQMPPGMKFAQRFEAGGWLVGGEHGVLAVCGTSGVRELVQAPDPAMVFGAANGRFDTLLVAVGQRPGEPPSLCAMSARRWLAPVPLHGVQNVSTLVRLDELRWLFGGRLVTGEGFVAVYAPVENYARRLETPHTRAFVSGASAYERELAMVVGSHGVAVRADGERIRSLVVEDSLDLTAAGLDILGREWVASLGALWTRDVEDGPVWQRVWHDPRWETPFISLMADAGMIVAMTADGGVIEGRDAAADSG